MRLTKSFRQIFLLLAILLTGSIMATGCSMIPDIAGIGSDSGSQDKKSQDREPDSQDKQDLESDGLAPDLGALSGNSEACISVAAVVIMGSTVGFIAKLDPNGEGTKKLATQVEESMKSVPKEVKGDLERLLSVVNESAVNGKTFDDEKFQKAMEPISKWVKKNCGGM